MPPRSRSGPRSAAAAAGLGVLLLGGWFLAPRPQGGGAPSPPRALPTTLMAREPPPDRPPAARPLHLPPLPARGGDDPGRAAGAPSDAEGLSPDDVRALEELSARVRAANVPIGPEDLRTIESVFARHPELVAAKQLLEATLVRLAAGQRAQGRTSDAEALLRRAGSLQPDDLVPRVALLDLLLDARDWTGAESVAGEILALSPRDLDALDRLAFALFRQDRNREAADVLRERLTIREGAEARALLARIEKALTDETGMTEQRLAHFNVRYDGEAHEEVGREVLRALERHYATLVTTLDYEPRATIPVILFSQQAYYDASGAPRWSGGVYDHLDGRIRVPIGGLTPSLGPEMDGTLIHELSHAFAAEITGGLTPTDVNEGLAQYMEAKRASTLLRPQELEYLAEGRIGGVAGAYLEALSFVEYLMGLRGQGGMNDLLRAMGETRSVDEAFQSVYGATAPQARSAWRARLRRQHGS